MAHLIELELHDANLDDGFRSILNLNISVCVYINTIGLDVELETNVIVEEGENKRPYVDPGRIDSIDDNVINAAGEPGLSKHQRNLPTTPQWPTLIQMRRFFFQTKTQK